MTDDRIYYARRAEEERAAAARAGSDTARRLHLELADLFAARLGDAHGARYRAGTPASLDAGACPT